jgi:hypothetical protein
MVDSRMVGNKESTTGAAGLAVQQSIHPAPSKTVNLHFDSAFPRLVVKQGATHHHAAARVLARALKLELPAPAPADVVPHSRGLICVGVGAACQHR